jgi:site-specific DNA-methyltransferase (adenine-specific)
VRLRKQIKPYWQSKDSCVTLYCGDCREILPQLPEGSVDAVVTDPPYGVEFAGKGSKEKTRNGIGYLTYADTEENIIRVCVPAVKMAISLAKRTCVTPGSRHARKYPQPDGEGVIWYAAGVGFQPWGFTTHQPILYYGKCPYLECGLGARPTGFASHETSPRNGHPCPKPIGVMVWLVNRATTRSCELVCDPFMGSGTTGVAAVRLGMRFIGIEIEERYCAIARRRIEAELSKPSLIPRYDVKKERKVNPSLLPTEQWKSKKKKRKQKDLL